MKKPLNILLIGLLLLTLAGGLIYWAFFSVGRLSGQEVLAVSDSPDGRWTVTAYRNNGGATTGYAVLATVKDNSSGKERNFYWQEGPSEATISWQDEVTVVINGHALNVTSDTYDYRRK